MTLISSHILNYSENEFGVEAIKYCLEKQAEKTPRNLF
jgi:hypothetical protein